MGLKSLSSFNRQFQKQYQMTPRQWEEFSQTLWLKFLAFWRFLLYNREKERSSAKGSRG
ncbi:MAG: hypothetical protein ACLR23_04765 [Clostridia bacterium]